MAISSRLRGITIEIDGDTTRLQDAFRDVDSQAGKLQHELMEVNKLLRMDPGNTELIAQQQELYNQQLSVSQQRLERLRQAEEQMQQKLEAGEIGAEQMRSFQREIIRTEQEIRNAENALRGLEEGADNAANAGEEMGKKIQDGLKKASLGIVTAVGAIATGGVMAFDDLQKALNQFQASTGTLEEEMGDVEEAIKNIYNNNLGESFDDIARAMAEVAQQTDLTGKELEDTTSYALLMRDTFDIDINESVRGVNALMKQFGISAEEAYNLIAIGAQNGLNQNQDLADQLAEYSVYYAEMGFSAEDMFNLIAQGAETGAFQIDFLNDAIKEFGIKTKDNSDATRAAFDALGMDADKLTEAFAKGGEEAKNAFLSVTGELMYMSDRVKQNEIGVALFGTKWEDVGVKSMDALMEMNVTLDTTKDALSEINAIKYDSIGEAFQGIGRQLQTGLLVPIGEMLLPALESLSRALQVVVDNMDIVGPVAAGLGVTIVGLTAAIQGQTVATKAAEAATKLFNLVMAANPGIKIAAIIAGVATTIIALIATNEDFRKAVTDIWNAVTSFIGQKIDEIGNFLNNFMQGAKEAWAKNTQAFRNSVDQVGNMLKGFVNSAVQLWDDFTNATSQAWDNIKNAVKEKVSSIIDGIIGGFAALPQKMLDVGRSIIDGISRGIDENVSRVYRKVENVGANVASTIKNKLQINSPSRVFREIGKNVVEGLEVGIEENTKLATNEVNRLGTSISDQYEKSFYRGFTASEGEIKDYLDNMVNYMRQSMSGILNKMVMPALDNSPLANAAINLSRGEQELQRTELSPSTETVQPITNIFEVNGATVRNDTDISRIAEELFSMFQASARGRGVRV